MIVSSAPMAIGQVVFATPMAANAAENDAKMSGFELGVDESMQAVVEDFKRYARRGLWEKAIEALEKVDQEKLRTGLLQSDDGYVLPAGEQLWRLQAELSGEFREAFRVFLNAKARKIFNEAMAEGVAPAKRDEGLLEVYQTFFVSDVGDNASNLLGDGAFRAGKFGEAIRYWQHLLDYHPDSEIPEVRTVFKIGIGALQANDPVRLAESLRTLRERFPNEQVRFAGNDVPASETLARLVGTSEMTTGEIAAEGESSTPLRIPETLEIAWRHELIGETTFEKLASSEQNYYRHKGIASWVVPTTIVGDWLAYNYFGSTSAIELATGKLAWRHNDPAESVEKITGNIYQFTVDAYGVGGGAGRVVSRYIPPDEMNYYRAGADLVTYDVATGKQKWEVGLTKRGQSEWFHIGQPFVHANSGDEKPTVYVLATKTEGGEPYLRVHKGSKNTVHEVRLGRYREINVEDWNEKTIPTPRIIGWSEDGFLLIGIDEGAIIAVDVDNERVAWAFRYESPRLNRDTNVSRGASMETILHPKSSYRLVGRTLYIKDTVRPWLTALDLGRRKAAWIRRIEANSEIVAHDDAQLYVLGEELLALDRKNGDLRWAARLPMQNSGLSAVVVGQSLVVFTGRGLYELNRDDGSVIQIHREVDFDSNGGRVQLVGDLLITTSERNITAWQLERSGSTAPAVGKEKGNL